MHPSGRLDEVPKDVLPAQVRLSMFDGSQVPEGISLELVEGDVHASLLSDEDIAVAFLNSVCGGESWSLKVAAEVKTETPLFIEIRAGGHVAAARIHVEISRLAEADAIWTISGEAGWFGLLREGELKDGAVYREAFEQDISSSSVLLRAEGWQIGRDAQMATGELSLGGCRVRSDLRSSIAQGSSIKRLIASHGTSKRSDNHHLEVQHVVGDNQSKVVLHSACDDESRSASTGKLRIEPGADGSDAGQVYRNLLLSPRARAEAIPELEVLADDVSAAHGAASAPIDQEQMFYLESRGLETEEAEHLLVEGFLIAAMEGLGSDRLLDWLRTRLTIHLDCALLD